MIEPLLQSIEADALARLVGVSPHLTRRNPAFLPAGPGQRTLEVYARVTEQTGNPHAGEKTVIELRLRGTARESDSALAIDLARWMVDRSRYLLLTSGQPVYANHQSTTYNETVDVESGFQAYSCEAVLRLEVTHRSDNPAILGIVQRMDGEFTEGHALAELATRGIVIAKAEAFHEGPVLALYANAQAGDVVELLDASDTVVATANTTPGFGQATLTPPSVGTYRVALFAGTVRIKSALTTTIIQEPSA